MKLFIYGFIFVMVFVGSLGAKEDQDAYRWRHSRELHTQLEALKQSIEATQVLLQKQENLYYLVDRYQRLHRKLEANPNDPSYFAPVVQAAVEVWEEIEKDDLSHLFDENFLDGLSFYIKIAERQGLTPPPT